MGKRSAPKPVHLAQKLLAIRTAFGVSQNGMIKLMGFEEYLTQAEISAFERGIRIPPLPVLLKYARVARFSVETLIDDEIELPNKTKKTNTRVSRKR